MIGGVGTGNNASLSDIFGNNGGGGGTTTPQPASVGALAEDGQGQAQERPGLAGSRRRLRERDPAVRRGAAPGSTYVALKPGNLDGLQRLALAQAQVATNYSNQAQSYQQQASSSSPGNDSTFSGGTLGSLSQDPVSQAQAASRDRPADRGADQGRAASPSARRPGGRSPTGTYGKIVVLPAFAKNDLAATVWLNYGSAAQSANDTKSAIKAYDAFLKLAPDDVNAPQVQDDPEAAQDGRDRHVTTQ